MPTLHKILADHAPVLLLDAASATVQVGWFATPTAVASWSTSSKEAGVGVFECIEDLGVELGNAGAFVFCEGPGSILGIRSTAMAIRTWNAITQRPVFSYQSLAIVAHVLAQPKTTVIADARRDSWHCLSMETPLARVPTSGLTGPLVMPNGFRHWTPVPPGTGQTPYTLSTLLPRIMDLDAFKVVDAPDAFLHDEPAYAKWTPQIHRAP